MTSNDRDQSLFSFITKRFGYDDGPISYLQFREAEYRLTRERKETMKQIGADIRNKCRAEIDEYVNCSAETNLVMFKCKNEAKELYKCVRIYQKDAATPEAQQKVMEERVRKGESVLKEIHL